MKISPSRPLKIFGYVMLIGCIGLVGLYGLVCVMIGNDVKEISDEASQLYPGDKIEALIAYMNSEDQSLQKRNRAIWALGQLGDERALSVLQKFYTGEPCDHSRYVCQHELEKAIKLCGGGLNITAIAWRRFVD